MQDYPNVTVGVLIYNDEGKILLAKSPKWFDKFIVPGGHIELKETVEDAAKREIKEEVGLDIEDLKFLFIQEAIYSKEFYKPMHFIFLEYVAHAKTTDVKIDGDEITDYVWVTPEEGLKLNIDSFTRPIIETYLKEKR